MPSTKVQEYFQSKTQFSNKYLSFCSGYTPSEWNLPPFGFNDMPAAPANRGHYDGVGSHLKQISIPDKTPTFISAEYLQQVFKNPTACPCCAIEYRNSLSEEIPVFWKLHNPCICEWYAWCAKNGFIYCRPPMSTKNHLSHLQSKIVPPDLCEKSPDAKNSPVF